MLTVAEVLYHATYPDFEKLIDENGLIPGVNDSVALCSSPSHAAGFVNMFGCSRIVAVRPTTLEECAKKIPSDLIVTQDFDVILVVGVRVADLDERGFTMNLFDRSQSANGVLPMYLQSYDYDAPIPPSAIIEKHWFDKGDKRIHNLFQYSHKRKHIA